MLWNVFYPHMWNDTCFSWFIQIHDEIHDVKVCLKEVNRSLRVTSFCWVRLCASRGFQKVRLWSSRSCDRAEQNVCYYVCYYRLLWTAMNQAWNNCFQIIQFHPMISLTSTMLFYLNKFFICSGIPSNKYLCPILNWKPSIFKCSYSVFFNSSEFF